MRRRRFTAALLVTALVALGATPALAGTDQENATVSVTVPTFLDIVFTDGTEDFGSMLGGTSADRLDALTYSIGHNGAVANLAITASGNGPGLFRIAKGESGNFALAVTINNGSVDNQWRTSIPTGPTIYKDSLRAVIPASQTAGTFTQTLTYTVTN